MLTHFKITSSSLFAARTTLWNFHSNNFRTKYVEKLPYAFVSAHFLHDFGLKINEAEKRGQLLFHLLFKIERLTCKYFWTSGSPKLSTKAATEAWHEFEITEPTAQLNGFFSRSFRTTIYWTNIESSYEKENQRRIDFWYSIKITNHRNNKTFKVSKRRRKAFHTTKSESK